MTNIYTIVHVLWTIFGWISRKDSFDISRMGQTREVVTHFAKYTTAHGFGSVLRSESWCGRGIWILAMLIAWTICCAQLAMNIMAYLQYSTKTSVSIQYSSSAQFPAVTFCNLNAARWSQMTDDKSLVNYTTDLKAARPETVPWADFANTTGPNDLFNQDIIDDETSYKLLYIQYIYQQQLPIASMGHQIEDMLLDCTFQGRQCAPENFTQWQHGTFGNCYTMIIAKDQFPSFIGPDYGLELTLLAEEYEYCPLISPAVGFRVELHSPSYIPFPEDLGFTISPGSLSSVAMQQVVITRQPLPYDGTDCCNMFQEKQNNLATNQSNIFQSWSNTMLSNGKHAGTNYTNEACKKSCYLLLLAQECGCVDAAYVTFEQMQLAYGSKQIPPACDYSNENNIHCVRTTTSNINAQCDTVCDQPCYEEDYDTRITGSLWPRLNYFTTIQDSWSKRNPRVANMTAQEATGQIAKLEVYFRVLNYEAITETPAMTLADLFTNVGGTLGLYGGFSLLTILEFFECCARLTTCRKQRARQSTPQITVAFPHNAQYVLQ